jgi:endonuclease/exonuclease/phosphatase family metal-dependent hydrolase
VDGASVRPFRFVWWNVQSFGHYDAAWVAEGRRQRLPSSPEEYTAKRQLLAAALREMMQDGGLDLIALAEVTGPAAHDLRQDVCPGFAVLAIAECADDFGGRPSFQVAFLYDPNAGAAVEDMLVPIHVSEASRPMAILDYNMPEDTLRVYACHFTSQIGEKASERNRSEMARQLNRHVYEFLRAGEGRKPRRHVLILGDLNEEPFGMLEEDLFARRERRWVRTAHAADAPIRRARLYNCGWRLLGERVAHPNPRVSGQAAGTYYSDAENRWYTWDHVLVSGSLLTDQFPYLDEESVEVVSGPGLVGADGRPARFRFTNGQAKGLSDHLPVRGRLLP